MQLTGVLAFFKLAICDFSEKMVFLFSNKFVIVFIVGASVLHHGYQAFCEQFFKFDSFFLEGSIGNFWQETYFEHVCF